MKHEEMGEDEFAEAEAEANEEMAEDEWPEDEDGDGAGAAIDDPIERMWEANPEEAEQDGLETPAAKKAEEPSRNKH